MQSGNALTGITYKLTPACAGWGEVGREGRQTLLASGVTKRRWDDRTEDERPRNGINVTPE